MRKILSVFSISLLTCATCPAWAAFGPSTGGGGFAVACPETPVSAAKTELLDIYEGRNTLQFKMASPSGNLQKDYFEGVKRTYTLQGHPNLADERREAIYDNLVKFMQGVKFVPKPKDMPMAQDLGEKPWIPSQCELKQVAYYDDQSEVIFVLEPVWDELDSLSKAALVHHELWYRLQRQSGEKTSENSRRAVAHAFSLSGVVAIDEGVPAKTPEFSNSGGSNSSISVFYGINYVGSNITRLQFIHFNGVGQLSKTTADFPLMNWKFKLARSQSNPSLIDCILQTPEIDQEHSAPLQGLMAKGYTVQLRVKTGEPVIMRIIKNGILMSEGNIGGGNNCSSSL